MLPASNLHVRPRPGGTCFPPSVGNRIEPRFPALPTQQSQLPWTTHTSYSPEEPQKGKAIGEKENPPATGNAS